MVEADGRERSYKGREGDTQTDRRTDGQTGRGGDRPTPAGNTWKQRDRERGLGGSKQSFLYTAAPRSHLAAPGDDISRHYVPGRSIAESPVSQHPYPNNFRSVSQVILTALIGTA